MSTGGAGRAGERPSWNPKSHSQLENEKKLFEVKDRINFLSGDNDKVTEVRQLKELERDLLSAISDSPQGRAAYKVDVVRTRVVGGTSPDLRSKIDEQIQYLAAVPLSHIQTHLGALDRLFCEGIDYADYRAYAQSVKTILKDKGSDFAQKSVETIFPRQYARVKELVGESSTVSAALMQDRDMKSFRALSHQLATSALQLPPLSQKGVWQALQRAFDAKAQSVMPDASDEAKALFSQSLRETCLPKQAQIELLFSQLPKTAASDTAAEAHNKAQIQEIYRLANALPGQILVVFDRLDTDFPHLKSSSVDDTGVKTSSSLQLFVDEVASLRGKAHTQGCQGMASLMDAGIGRDVLAPVVKLEQAKDLLGTENEADIDGLLSDESVLDHLNSRLTESILRGEPDAALVALGDKLRGDYSLTSRIGALCALTKGMEHFVGGEKGRSIKGVMDHMSALFNRAGRGKIRLTSSHDEIDKFVLDHLEGFAVLYLGDAIEKASDQVETMRGVDRQRKLQMHDVFGSVLGPLYLCYADGEDSLVRRAIDGYNPRGKVEFRGNLQMPAGAAVFSALLAAKMGEYRSGMRRAGRVAHGAVEKCLPKGVAHLPEESAAVREVEQLAVAMRKGSTIVAKAGVDFPGQVVTHCCSQVDRIASMQHRATALHVISHCKNRQLRAALLSKDLETMGKNIAARGSSGFDEFSKELQALDAMLEAMSSLQLKHRANVRKAVGVSVPDTGMRLASQYMSDCISRAASHVDGTSGAIDASFIPSTMRPVSGARGAQSVSENQATTLYLKSMVTSLERMAQAFAAGEESFEVFEASGQIDKAEFQQLTQDAKASAEQVQRERALTSRGIDVVAVPDMSAYIGVTLDLTAQTKIAEAVAKLNPENLRDKEVVMKLINQMRSPKEVVFLLHLLEGSLIGEADFGTFTVIMSQAMQKCTDKSSLLAISSMMFNRKEAMDEQTFASFATLIQRQGSNTGSAITFDECLALAPHHREGPLQEVVSSFDTAWQLVEAPSSTDAVAQLRDKAANHYTLPRSHPKRAMAEFVDRLKRLYPLRRAGVTPLQDFRSQIEHVLPVCYFANKDKLPGVTLEQFIESVEAAFMTTTQTAFSADLSGFLKKQMALPEVSSDKHLSQLYRALDQAAEKQHSVEDLMEIATTQLQSFFLRDDLTRDQLEILVKHTDLIIANLKKSASGTEFAKLDLIRESALPLLTLAREWLELPNSLAVLDACCEKLMSGATNHNKRLAALAKPMLSDGHKRTIDVLVSLQG